MINNYERSPLFYDSPFLLIHPITSEHSALTITFCSRYICSQSSCENFLSLPSTEGMSVRRLLASSMRGERYTSRTIWHGQMFSFLRIITPVPVCCCKLQEKQGAYHCTPSSSYPTRHLVTHSAPDT